MKIIDILIDSAFLLGLTDEADVLQSATAETESEIINQNKNVASLLNLVKYSIRELCTNYIPVVRTVSIETKDKKFAVSELENFIRIQNIQQEGQMVKFKIINRNVIFEEDGVYDVKYETYPNINQMFEEIDFLENFSPDAIVLGLCAYYSLAKGMFDEFQSFHEKYVSKAESLKSLHNFKLPSRRWR